MPEGSSSAAPVTMPGPSRLKKSRFAIIFPRRWLPTKAYGFVHTQYQPKDYGETPILVNLVQTLSIEPEQRRFY
jgi:hypothetical protein